MQSAVRGNVTGCQAERHSCLHFKPNFHFSSLPVIFNETTNWWNRKILALKIKYSECLDIFEAMPVLKHTFPFNFMWRWGWNNYLSFSWKAVCHVPEWHSTMNSFTAAIYKKMSLSPPLAINYEHFHCFLSFKDRMKNYPPLFVCCWKFKWKISGQYAFRARIILYSPFLGKLTKIAPTCNVVPLNARWIWCWLETTGGVHFSKLQALPWSDSCAIKTFLSFFAQYVFSINSQNLSKANISSPSVIVLEKVVDIRLFVSL